MGYSQVVRTLIPHTLAPNQPPVFLGNDQDKKQNLGYLFLWPKDERYEIIQVPGARACQLKRNLIVGILDERIWRFAK